MRPRVSRLPPVSFYRVWRVSPLPVCVSLHVLRTPPVSFTVVLSVHSQCLKFDTQDTGPAYIRVRLQLARGPLDTFHSVHTPRNYL